MARTTRPTLTGSSAAARRTLDLRVRMRAQTVEEFLERYSAFVEDDRIFIFTRAAQPVGTRLRFTLALASGAELLRGQGIVHRLSVDGERSGMELLFVPIGDDSVALLEQLRARREAALATAEPAAVTPAPDDEPAPLETLAAPPRFGEDWVPLPDLVPESSALPVNPLDGISEGALDYFLQWSLTPMAI